MQVCFQEIKNDEYESTARSTSSYCDTTASVETFEAILSVYGSSFVPECNLRGCGGYRDGLHPRLDGVGRKKEEIVGHAGRRASNSLLPER